MTEFGFIDHIKELFAALPDNGFEGIGDDCAVLDYGGKRVVVTTDLAARGIDIAQLPAVVNYDLPRSAVDYVHRIGRTGRAGKKGKAVSLVSSEERHRLADIQKLIKLEIRQEVVPGYDPEPDFFDAEGGKRRRSSSSSSSSAPSPSAAPRAAEGSSERRKRSEREPREARETREPRERGHRSRQPSHIAPDGFDFSKPYEQRNPAGEAGSTEGDSAIAELRSGQKPQRPIAFLLGGLGRKH